MVQENLYAHFIDYSRKKKEERDAFLGFNRDFRGGIPKIGT